MSIKGLAISLLSSVRVFVDTAGVSVQSGGGDAPAGVSASSGQNQLHAGELVRIVRESTGRFRDVNQATAEGYQLLFGCVSGPDDGAMGLHYVNMELVG